MNDRLRTIRHALDRVRRDQAEALRAEHARRVEDLARCRPALERASAWLAGQGLTPAEAASRAPLTLPVGVEWNMIQLLALMVNIRARLDAEERAR